MVVDASKEKNRKPDRSMRIEEVMQAIIPALGLCRLLRWRRSDRLARDMQFRAERCSFVFNNAFFRTDLSTNCTANKLRCKSRSMRVTHPLRVWWNFAVPCCNNSFVCHVH